MNKYKSQAKGVFYIREISRYDFPCKKSCKKIQYGDLDLLFPTIQCKTPKERVNK